VLNERTILVIQDTAQKRQQYEEQIIRTFYVSHADPQEIYNMINQIVRIQGIAITPVVSVNKTANTITVRGTPNIVNILEKVIQANDRPRAEIIIDVELLEVSRQRAKEFGLNLAQYQIGAIFSPEGRPGTTDPGTGNGGNAAGVGGSTFNLNTISQGISTSDFYLTVPTAVVKFLEQDTRTKLIAKPQLRGAEGTKLTMNLGDQIPVLSTVFGAAAAGGFASVPQSSFNYKDVGVNLEMTPRVTYEGEIVLDGFIVESSSLGPSISVAGQEVPSFSSRKVGTKLRLREGESTLLAGLLRDEQRKILSGFPGIIRMPVLRSLFGQTTDEINQSDIVMLLTPHIVRTHELTVEDLSPIFIGTQQNVGLGGPPPLIGPQPVEAPAPAPSAPAPAQPATPAETVPGVPRSLANPPPGVPPTNPAPPPGTSQVPTLTPPPGTAVATVPGLPAPGAGAPAVTPPAAEPPVATLPPKVPEGPPRDPNAPPAAPGAASAATAAHIIITPPGTEFRVAGGPYTVPVSINNASRVSNLTLTVTFNPNVLRVRTVQDGTFMRQGGVTTSFTPRIDAAAGRVDIAITRTADQAGASGAGLLAALLFDAVGPGGSLIQVNGVGNTPEGAAVPLQFNPVNVTVR
jgi:Flp pilus assembly secretin CpaC